MLVPPAWGQSSGEVLLSVDRGGQRRGAGRPRQRPAPAAHRAAPPMIWSVPPTTSMEAPPASSWAAPPLPSWSAAPTPPERLRRPSLGRLRRQLGRLRRSYGRLRHRGSADPLVTRLERLRRPLRGFDTSASPPTPQAAPPTPHPPAPGGSAVPLLVGTADFPWAAPPTPSGAAPPTRSWAAPTPPTPC